MNGLFARPAKTILGCQSNAPMCPNTTFLTQTVNQTTSLSYITINVGHNPSVLSVNPSVLPSIQPSDQRSKIARRAVRLAGLVRLVQPSRPPVLLSVRPSTPSVCPTRQTNVCDKSDDKSDDQTVGQNKFTLFCLRKKTKNIEWGGPWVWTAWTTCSSYKTRFSSCRVLCSHVGRVRRLCLSSVAFIFVLGVCLFRPHVSSSLRAGHHLCHRWRLFVSSVAFIFVISGVYFCHRRRLFSSSASAIVVHAFCRACR